MLILPINLRNYKSIFKSLTFVFIATLMFIATGVSSSAATFDIENESDIIINGELAGDGAGTDVYVADVNGDQVEDLVIGAYQFSNVTKSGKVYIIFGPINSGTIELATDADVVIGGIDPRDFTGYGVGVGFLNDDSSPDLIIGLSGADPSGRTDAGETHVVFGPILSGNYSLSSLSDVVINGIDSGDRSGNAVASGDVNGDGKDDVIVGALAASPSGRNRAGESYVLFGPLSAGVRELASADIKINGIDPLELSGSDVALGDLNNDGNNDVLIGSSNANAFVSGQSSSASPTYETGLVSVIFGPLSSGTYELSSESDIYIHGIDKFDALGSVKSGDVNHDGVDDLLLGASGADPNGDSNAGEAYVIFGPLLTSGLFSVSAIATDVYNGTDSGDGLSRGSIGDVNGDNYNDIVITSGQADAGGRIDSGEVYVVLSEVNQAPILNNIGDKTIDENNLLEFTVTATDPDDGDILTLSSSNIPLGSTFNAETGVFSWIPGYGDSGNYLDIEFTVMDNGSPMKLDVELITITVGDVNRPPEISNPGPQEIAEGEYLEYSINTFDLDGDSVNLTATSVPLGASFDGSVFSWTPSLSQSGVYVVTFIATDDGAPNEISVRDVTITVGDEPTPSEQAEYLVNDVINLNLSSSIENSYLANLQKVEQFILDGKIQAALNQLNAFALKLSQDLSQGKISVEDYDALVSSAQNLINDISNL